MQLSPEWAEGLQFPRGQLDTNEIGLQMNYFYSIPVLEYCSLLIRSSS